MSERLIFTVTNDLSYDQRMQRICGTLAEKGYDVTLVGRQRPASIPLAASNFRQHRLRCRFEKGFLFYAEYNLRLFFWLLRQPADAICSIDLDSLPAGAMAALLRGKKRVFDAHEYFTEVPEVVGRPFVRLFWAMVGRVFLPFYRHAYTVGPALAAIFSKKYGIPFEVVRNVPRPKVVTPPPPECRFLLYQGALNAGRGIETALQAMQQLPELELWLAGEGDLSAELRELACQLGVESQVRFLGYVQPEALKMITAQAWLGLNLLENKGLSYYYSLANKFFDYVQAEVPVVTMDFPEYRALQAQFPVAVLLPDLEIEAFVEAIRGLLARPEDYASLQLACRQARTEWNWDKEQLVLIRCWSRVFA